MTKDKPVYFAFYVDDWVGGTLHLDHTAKSCYLSLLLFQFEHEHIPEEPTVRMQLCGIQDVGQWERIWRHIGDKFEVGNDGKYRNTKMAKEREEARKRRQAAIDRGRKGGLAKASSTKDQLKTNSSNQNQNQNQSKNRNRKPEPEPKNKWAAPSLSEVREYCDKRFGDGQSVRARNCGKVDAETFFDYYTAQGWKLANGRQMKDWRAAVRTWEARQWRTTKTAIERSFEGEL